MFTKQEIEFLLNAMTTMHLSGTFGELQDKAKRIQGIREKLDLLAADHPEDEEVKKKPTTKKPTTKKSTTKK